jgi:hypothetical protein
MGAYRKRSPLKGREAQWSHYVAPRRMINGIIYPLKGREAQCVF